MPKISTVHDAQILLADVFKAGLTEDSIRQTRASLIHLKRCAQTQAEYRAIQGMLDTLGSAQSYAEYRKSRRQS
jgi:hypothetical protein